MSEEKTTVENNGQQEAEDLKELLQIRRDKLSALQELSLIHISEPTRH